ncbi:MAG: YVTN family beta-propeller repeat protein [Terriglobales bacterium]
MRTSKLFLVPLALTFSAYVAAQSPIASPQPSTAGMQPGIATSMQPSPDPIVKPAPPVIRRDEKTPQPNVNLQVPLPERALIRRIAMVDIPGRPGFKDLVFINGCLVMAHPAASTVDVFSVAKRRVIAQIKDMKGASGVAADPAGERVFVANSDAGEIAVISTKTWQVENRISLKAAPDALLFVPETSTLYASNGRDHSISVIDTKQGTVLNTVVVDGRPEYLAFDPASRQIYASLEDVRQVAVLDPTLKVLKRFPLTASMPTGLALDSKARRLYVAVRHAVVELDADSGQEIRRVPAPDGVDMLWLDPASTSLYGAASGGTIALMKIGNGVFEAQREYSTEVHGHTLAFDPAKKMIYLPGGRDGRSKLLILRRVEPNEPSPNPEVAKK